MKKAEEGLLFRTSSEHTAEDEISQELEELRAEYQSLERQVQGTKKAGKDFRA